MEMIAKTASLDVHTACDDLQGAQSWMATICGPHGLKLHSKRRLRFSHSGSVLRSRSASIGCVEYGADVSVLVDEGTPLHSFSVSLPLTGEQELTVQGQRILSTPKVGTVLAPNVPQELQIAGNCRKMLVSLSRAAVMEMLEELLQHPASAPLEFAPVIDAASGESASWWRIVRHLFGELQSPDSLYRSQHMAGEIERSLIRGFLLAQPSNYSDELHGAWEGRAPQYLLRARQYIIDTAREDIGLEDIEQAAGVSRFKLYEGFRQHFGATPLAYRKKYRLEQVRKDILRGGAQKYVSGIAMDWGFTHLGRFSIEYRKQFGELPSDTLRRQRGGA